LLSAPPLAPAGLERRLRRELFRATDPDAPPRLGMEVEVVPLVAATDRPCPVAAEPDASATASDWNRHLTTLFPEVRPRGYLELRCFDALPLRWYGAPAALVSGILYDDDALRVALEILPAVVELLEDFRRSCSDRGEDDLL
jgi:Glutamate-cysteine ligase family 2(GCS2)